MDITSINISPLINVTIARNCMTKKEEYKRKNKKRYHANLEEEEPPKKLATE